MRSPRTNSQTMLNAPETDQGHYTALNCTVVLQFQGMRSVFSIKMRAFTMNVVGEPDVAALIVAVMLNIAL